MTNAGGGASSFEELLTLGSTGSAAGSLQAVQLSARPESSATFSPPPPSTASAPAGVSVRYMGTGSGSSPGSGSGTGSGLDAAWRLEPGGSGDYLVRLEVAGRTWWRWVVVDLDPPRLYGTLYVANASLPNSEPVAVGEQLEASSLRYLLAVLEVSEPVRPFNISAAAVLGGGARLVGATCYAAASSARDVAARASATPLTGDAGGAVTVSAGNAAVAADAAAPPPRISTAFDTSAAAAASAEALAATSGGYVQSCVLVLVAPGGSAPSVSLAAGAVVDLVGNPSAEPLLLSGQLEEPGSAPAADGAAAVASAALGGVFAGSALASASASFLSMMSTRSSLLQSAYHIQMLAMSSNLASPGVSGAYRQIARYLRWSLLGIKGNIPLLDSAFTSGQTTVNVSDAAADRLAVNADGTNPGGFPGNDSSPPSSAVFGDGNDPLLEALRNQPLTLVPPPGSRPPFPSLIVRRRGLRQAPAAALAAPPPAPRPPPPATGVTNDTGRDELVTWLQQVGAVNDGGGGGSRGNSSAGGGNKTSSDYVIGGAAAGGDGVVQIAPDGSVVVTAPPPGAAAPPMDAVPPPPPTASQPDLTYVADIQDLLYTLAVATIMMAALVVLHGIIILIYRLAVGPDVPWVLRFPRAEFILAGLLLVALTFYACLALGSPVGAPEWQASRLPAVLVLLLLAAPFALVLWWLTVCRWYLEETPTDLFMLGPHWQAFFGAMPGGGPGGEGKGEGEAGGKREAEAAAEEAGAEEEEAEDTYGLGPHWAMAPTGADPDALGYDDGLGGAGAFGGVPGSGGGRPGSLGGRYGDGGVDGGGAAGRLVPVGRAGRPRSLQTGESGRPGSALGGSGDGTDGTDGSGGAGGVWAAGGGSGSDGRRPRSLQVGQSGRPGSSSANDADDNAGGGVWASGGSGADGRRPRSLQAGNSSDGAYGSIGAGGQAGSGGDGNRSVGLDVNGYGQPGSGDGTGSGDGGGYTVGGAAGAGTGASGDGSRLRSLQASASGRPGSGSGDGAGAGGAFAVGGSAAAGAGSAGGGLSAAGFAVAAGAALGAGAAVTGGGKGRNSVGGNFRPGRGLRKPAGSVDANGNASGGSGSGGRPDVGGDFQRGRGPRDLADGDAGGSGRWGGLEDDGGGYVSGGPRTTDRRRPVGGSLSRDAGGDGDGGWGSRPGSLRRGGAADGGGDNTLMSGGDRRGRRPEPEMRPLPPLASPAPPAPPPAAGRSDNLMTAGGRRPRDEDPDATSPLVAHISTAEDLDTTTTTSDLLSSNLMTAGGYRPRAESPDPGEDLRPKPEPEAPKKKKAGSIDPAIAAMALNPMAVPRASVLMAPDVAMAAAAARAAAKRPPPQGTVPLPALRESPGGDAGSRAAPPPAAGEGRVLTTASVTAGRDTASRLLHPTARARSLAPPHSSSGGLDAGQTGLPRPRSLAGTPPTGAAAAAAAATAKAAAAAKPGDGSGDEDEDGVRSEALPPPPPPMRFNSRAGLGSALRPVPTAAAAGDGGDGTVLGAPPPPPRARPPGSVSNNAPIPMAPPSKAARTGSDPRAELAPKPASVGGGGGGGAGPSPLSCVFRFMTAPNAKPTPAPPPPEPEPAAAAPPPAAPAPRTLGWFSGPAAPTPTAPAAAVVPSPSLKRSPSARRDDGPPSPGLALPLPPGPATAADAAASPRTAAAMPTRSPQASIVVMPAPAGPQWPARRRRRGGVDGDDDGAAGPIAEATEDGAAADPAAAAASSSGRLPPLRLDSASHRSGAIGLAPASPRTRAVYFNPLSHSNARPSLGPGPASPRSSLGPYSPTPPPGAPPRGSVVRPFGSPSIISVRAPSHSQHRSRRPSVLAGPSEHGSVVLVGGSGGLGNKPPVADEYDESGYDKPYPMFVSAEDRAATGPLAPPDVDLKLIPEYPGKFVAMYRLRYRPGCWPLRLRVTPPIPFLARFEFLFEDAIGEGAQQVGRETKAILSVTAVNFTHKAACAVVFGTFGLRLRSAAQLGLLVALQAAMLAYLAAARPFVEWQLLSVEVACHALELTLFACALALLRALPDNAAPTTYIMIVCFFLVALLVLVYEIRRLWLMLKAAWHMWRNRGAGANRDSHLITAEEEGAEGRDGKDGRGRDGRGSGGSRASRGSRGSRGSRDSGGRRSPQAQEPRARGTRGSGAEAGSGEEWDARGEQATEAEEQAAARAEPAGPLSPVRGPTTVSNASAPPRARNGSVAAGALRPKRRSSAASAEAASVAAAAPAPLLAPAQDSAVEAVVAGAMQQAEAGVEGEVGPGKEAQHEAEAGDVVEVVKVAGEMQVAEAAGGEAEGEAAEAPRAPPLLEAPASPTRRLLLPPLAARPADV
ncbi:hypothetical protein HYH03_009075 [Edaphochlamys debaryana]|uniref:Minus agglutinin n=1 Tax=Edaphochlamys debaryana TaxID=47281 RepID=A0A835XZ53_9CHLO|nr:hypothetical protein HYH03_009075 [Edaphochlamys debaryana]|eukprot:KAG2492660.1 hypothetical protein HYH03_009075 [Edaphochlamys debaryana]